MKKVVVVLLVITSTTLVYAQETIPYSPVEKAAADCYFWAENNCKSVLYSKTNCSPVRQCWWMPLTKQWYCETEVVCWEDYKAVCRGKGKPPSNTHVNASGPDSLYCTVGDDNTMYDRTVFCSPSYGHLDSRCNVKWM